jgi:hypothetical protein
MEGKLQYFNASIEAQQYASGGTAAYQRAFLVILFAVFILDFLALAYFLTHRDWYADVSEPSNLFSLAINSPPSKELAGSCGGGPHGKQFRSSWTCTWRARTGTLAATVQACDAGKDCLRGLT